MEEGRKQNSDLHYEMPISLKSPHTSLPSSEPVTIMRLKQLKLHINRNMAYVEDYNQFMPGPISKNFAEMVPDRELEGQEGKVW